ncbi:uncharacterized protein LOC100902018 [Galendromus occidentalis]|uniref:Uncharacterized protein LOC100902018 n=1 Tax=Galendromus occidentalis TaxID=34638 RepID=A0AAJ6QSZ1_9ACAR|nr:uncharacterized protein LOC100902018 [Galendromus occidentalis]
MRGPLLMLAISLAVATIAEAQYTSPFLIEMIATGRSQSCFKCRSRGDRGDCKDPFMYNATAAEKVKGIKVEPCASKWCGKIIEGKEDDQDFATERLCLQRPPDDKVERCADVVHKRKNVFMCFCSGDLCNSSARTTMSFIHLAIAFLITRFLL